MPGRPAGQVTELFDLDQLDIALHRQYGFVAMDVEPDWGLQPTGWRVRVHGDAPFDVRMPFPVPLDELASVVPAFNANGLVNAIPYVCAAPQGILTTEDLPHILPRRGQRNE